MSEEILKAMMELFALIVKQDGGMLQRERDYVSDFLNKQLPQGSAEEFLKLFLENAGPLQTKGSKDTITQTSVRDSVKTLAICTSINKTITQEQRVIVLMRCFELIDSDKEYTPQRMNIINTIAEVFRVSREEFESIWMFIREERAENFKDRSMLVVRPSSGDPVADNELFLVFLKVDSVNLYFIRSFGSRNVRLNGLPVSNRKTYTFAPGSTVQAPPASPVYYSDIVSRMAGKLWQNHLSFFAEKLTLKFSDGSPAISDLSFSSDEGKLIGIMGSSGTGKTTLLNVLCGLIKPDSGDVRINGVSIFSPGTRLDGVIGYVPQDDILLEDLTVFENLYYAASFCFGDRDRKQLSEIVNDTLRTLGLYEKRDFRVGSPLNKIISGGQRKRLNIALELIREPSVLFLDEPTSGLSSRDSDNVMDLLHDLTLKGKIVITVIHQPSSDIFKGFDKLLLLDQEGQMVYYGNPVEALIYFRTLDSQINSEAGECPVCGTANPEILFDIIENTVVDEFGRHTETRKVMPEEWAGKFRDQKPAEKINEISEEPTGTLRRPSWFRQTFLYLVRDIKRKLANRQYLLMTFLEGPVLGLILSYIIRYIEDPSSEQYIFRENENIPVYIFMSIIVALFMGLTISSEEIFRDRKMLKREHFLSLNRGSYLASKVVLLALISSIQTLTFLLIANTILGISGLFFSYWLALFVTALCANLIGLNISSAFDDAVTIYIAIPLIMIPMMVLSGAMFSFDKLNRDIGRVDKVPLFAEFMPTRWIYEALMVREFKDNEYDRRVYPLKKQISVSDFNTIYRLPRILAESEAAAEMALGGEESTLYVKKLQLVRNETERLSERGLAEPFYAIDSIAPGKFRAEVGRKLGSWLEETAIRLALMGNAADARLDSYIGNNREKLNLLYDNYHNDKLEDIVRKVYEKNKILEYKGHLIQNIDLIYLDPEPEGLLDFRTHFMAPVKNMLGRLTDTYLFNVFIVLLFTIISYFLLYYEILRRIITFFSSLRPQRLTK